jgi:peptidoglycan/LPS O-acetylase OafA/YrhL
VLHWLHVSKYPPSLTYVTLELGIAALLLAAFAKLRTAGALAPLRMLGRTSLFFYLLHAHVLVAAAAMLGMLHKGDIGIALLAAAATLALLYPLCIRYARYKAAHPQGIARYV